ncbi:MAG TPA: STM4015 family protein [Anaerolineae bacterium]|nr:STM4015 family protein [Anaerolineae bacterium]
MTIGRHLSSFQGFSVVDYEAPLVPEAGVAYRLRLGWEAGKTWLNLFDAFLAEERVAEVEGIVVGAWGEMWDAGSGFIVDALLAAREQLPNLKMIFMGDVTYEENEISWMVQSDMGRLLKGYPALVHFGVRGGGSLRFKDAGHDNLQSLVVQTGGLDRGVVHDILAGEWPALRHLELWLGTANYGATSRAEDIAPLLMGDLLPSLRYLGLRDSDIADDLAATLALAPVLGEIEVLDLSLGTLSDAGGRALLNSPHVPKLKGLILHHHFMSDQMCEQLEALPIRVDVSDGQDDEDDWRFVAVGE